jgi:hypothetical protein
MTNKLLKKTKGEKEGLDIEKDAQIEIDDV